MGDQGTVTRLEDPVQDGPEIHGRGDGRRFHQDGLRSMLQQVPLIQAVFEDCVNHVFRRQIQRQPPGIDRFQLVEPRPDFFRRIGDVLHDMRSEPDFRDALLLQPSEDGQGIFLRLHAVVQTIQDMAVVIDSPAKQPAFQDRLALIEKSEHQPCYFSSSLP